ncbi:hypothetical protein RCL1_002247 [Eukaryota sp. TZLM3-RCL]
MSFFSTDYATDFFQSAFDIESPVIAHKIKDGLYIGGAEAAYRHEFIFSNKITHIINCAAGQVDERFGSQGYLSFPWRDDSSCVIIDADGRTLKKVSLFIKTARTQEQCVLIHSLHGKSRCIALTCAYLMDLYGWTLSTARDFLAYKTSLQQVKPHLWRQLEIYSNTLISNPRAISPDTSYERDLLFNTHLNTSLGGLIEPREGPLIPIFKPHRPRVRRKPPTIRFGEVYVQPQPRLAASPGTPILKVKEPLVAPFGTSEEEWEKVLKEREEKKKEEVERGMAELIVENIGDEETAQNTTIMTSPLQSTPTITTTTSNSSPIISFQSIKKKVVTESSSESEQENVPVPVVLSPKFFAIEPSPKTPISSFVPVEQSKIPSSVVSGQAIMSQSMKSSSRMSGTFVSGSVIRPSLTSAERLSQASRSSTNSSISTSSLSTAKGKVKSKKSASTVSSSLLASTVASSSKSNRNRTTGRRNSLTEREKVYAKMASGVANFK